MVDDEETWRKAVAVVAGQSYDALTASDSEEALATVGRERPDLIVRDVMIAHRCEGFDVAKKL